MTEPVYRCDEDTGQMTNEIHPDVECDMTQPCTACGATLKAVETQECVFCRHD